MGLFEAALAIIKAVWPYLRESLFEGGTVRQWMRKYKWTLIWFGLVFVLFMINFFMFDQYVKLQVERNNLLQDNHELYEKYTVGRKALAIKALDEFKALEKVKTLQVELDTAVEQLAETNAKLEEHRGWERSCSLSVTAIEAGRATCPVRSAPRPIAPAPRRPTKTTRPKPTPTVEQPAPENPPKPSLAERLRKIFGGGDPNNVK